MNYELILIVALMPFFVLVLGASGIIAILLYLWSKDKL